jgi:hypothetical protein
VAQLLDDPRNRRMFSRIEVQDSSAVVRDDEKPVKNAKGERRHGKEIHGGDCFAIIAQKRNPSFRRLRIPWSFPHPTQHSPFRIIEAKHFQLAMDPGRTPGSVRSSTESSARTRQPDVDADAFACGADDAEFSTAALNPLLHAL